MSKIRATYRTILFFLITYVLYAMWLIGIPIVRYSRLAFLKWRTFALRTWARAVVRLIRLKITVTGTPPKPPFFLVSNHLGYLDMIAYLTKIDCLFIAKSDIEQWPLFGRLTRDMGMIFIDRNKVHDIPRVIDLIEHALHEDCSVALFPEGTSSAGADIKPFRTSLLEPLVKMHHPVHYATITYRVPHGEKPAHLSVCWWGGMKFQSHLIDMFSLPTFEAGITFGKEPILEHDRKVLAKKLHRAMSEQFVPVVAKDELTHEASC